MMNLFDIANTPELQDYINDNLFDPWVGTPLQGYRHMDNKQKGAFGEKYVELAMRQLGHDVQPPSSSTAGHDRVIDGILTEIKFSVSHTDNKKRLLTEDSFTMNHCAVTKDWERLIFFGVNLDPSKFRAKFITKEDFIKCLEEGKYFNPQQGGKKANNDDWLLSGKKLAAFLESEYVKDLTEW
jgi:hypothetical protein